MLRLPLVVCLVGIHACEENDTYVDPIEEYARVLSPDGEVSAYVYHNDSSSGGLTQVMLDFVNMECGMGSAAWHEYDIGVELRWIDTDTLEVTYPDGIPYRHNASGDYLGCYNRPVRVVMVPRHARDPAGGTRKNPVGGEHTTSPDGMVTAQTIRYSTEAGGITQVALFFDSNVGCGDSAATFYDDEVELQLDWADAKTLDIRYPEDSRYDLPPWGTTARCVTDTVQVRVQPLSD